MTTQGVDCLLQLAKAESKRGLAEGWAKVSSSGDSSQARLMGFVLVCPDGCVATTCGVLSVRALSSLPQNQTPTG